tara:strand:+ start:2022 stop:4394 length:2373 start_codon:yes stop_codon:yes gene_type:complete
MNPINQSSALSTILYEHVCPKRLAQLIKCPEVGDDIKKELQKYAKKFDRSKNAYRVNYEFKGLHYGRRYADKSLSLQNFKSEIRETLVWDTHTDIDIKNCHPVLLAQYCDKNNIPCVALKDYINHRDARIQELVDAYKCDRKTAKLFMIKLLYLGEINVIQLDMGFEMPFTDPDWVFNFANELKTIGQVIIGLNNEVFLDVKKLRKDEYKNKVATTMSYIICRIEDQIIQNAVIKLRQNKIEVDTLCFDGVLVNKKDVSHDILEELSSYCYQATDYQVEFDFKPMKSHYTLKAEQYDFSEHEFLHLGRWNQEYCASLEGQTPDETFALRKAYFEKHFCKVLFPDPMFIYQRHSHEDRKPEILSKPAMATMLEPVMSGLEGMRPSFFQHWCSIPNQRYYDKMDFIPYNPSRPAEDDRIFNLFEGFNSKCFADSSIDGSFMMKKIRPFLDLTHEICGGDDDSAEYFHRFIADIFQNPAKKPPVAICIKSKEGVGKNVLLDTIGSMLGGKAHYITSSNPDDFFGNHAEGFKGKLLINLNEAEGKGTFDYEGRIKSFITEPTITINPKNIRPMEINNYARTIVTTNKPTPIAIDVKGKDRRWVVFQSTEKTLTYSRTFWGKLISHFQSTEFIQALYQYYTEVIDNTNFDWAKQRPITTAYRTMCDKFQPVPVLFLEEFIRDEKWVDYGIDGKGDASISINTMDLFNAFNQFKKIHLFTREGTATNSRAFQGQLMELGLPVEKIKTMGNMVYRFVPDSVYEAMEQRAMINSWKFDEAERQKMEVSVVEAPDDYFV